MKFDLSEIEFSRNDLKQNIKLPSKLHEKLAYLLGIQIGDGYLKKVVRVTAVDYSIAYDGHHINESEFYATILKPLIKILFNKEVNIMPSTKGTVRIYFRSKAIFQFLNKVCGIPESPKTNISIPIIIKKSNLKIKRSFLRGLADTDFSLTFKKRVREAYPVIYFQTYSKPLYEDTIELLLELGFRIYHNYRKSYRYNKVHDGYYIQISGKNQLDKWMQEINFNSTNHLTRYGVWKKLGYLPVGTNITDRKLLLEK